jgi:hypothetical protein
MIATKIPVTIRSELEVCEALVNSIGLEVYVRFSGHRGSNLAVHGELHVDDDGRCWVTSGESRADFEMRDVYGVMTNEDGVVDCVVLK